MTMRKMMTIIMIIKMVIISSAIITITITMIFSKEDNDYPSQCYPLGD